MKGVCRGVACVSEKHANFIVNLGGATASDVLALARDVRERVRACFGVLLENEVCCWPAIGP
jgi:UDP-N-acetylmuramate dehydrogenase